jgi:hypothetical protein
LWPLSSFKSEIIVYDCQINIYLRLSGDILAIIRG